MTAVRLQRRGERYSVTCALCLTNQPTRDRYCERCEQVVRTFRAHGLEPPGRLDARVSSFGRVRSLARTVNRAGGQRRYSVCDRILMSSVNPQGYPIVTIPGRGTVGVHTLVCEAFLGPRPLGMQVLHRNDRKDDNRLGNLRWGTRSENARDAVRNGTHASRTRCKNSHDPADNTFVRSDGVRVCLGCIRDRDRRSAASWRARAMKAVEPESDSA